MSQIITKGLLSAKLIIKGFFGKLEAIKINPKGTLFEIDYAGTVYEDDIVGTLYENKVVGEVNDYS